MKRLPLIAATGLVVPLVFPLVHGHAARQRPASERRRLAGANRDATAVLVSQTEFPTAHSAKAVVLASDAAYPDALAGSPLAVAKHAPLLLTPPGSLAAVTATEISRVLPKGGTVYVLGAAAAVLSPTVATQIVGLGDIAQRIAGDDRIRYRRRDRRCCTG